MLILRVFVCVPLDIEHRSPQFYLQKEERASDFYDIFESKHGKLRKVLYFDKHKGLF